jgi:hypothetical protein
MLQDVVTAPLLSRRQRPALRIGGRWSLMMCAVSLFLGARADAARTDTAAPVIQHTPVEGCPAAVVGAPPPPCPVEAVITDDSGVFDPTLLVRLHGTTSFDRVPMTLVPDKPDTYVALVPPALATAGVVDYLIEAFDIQGNGPARVGSENAPLQLRPTMVTSPPTPPPTTTPPPPTTPTTTPTTPGPDDGDNTGLIVGIAAGVGAAVVVGAGIAVAVYALRAPAISTITVKTEAPSPFGAVTP